MRRSLRRQLFLNGEIWAVNHLLVARFQEREFFSYAGMDTIVKSTFPAFLNVMTRKIGVPVPITAEIGFIGVRGYSMLLNDHHSLGPVHADPKPVRAQLNTNSPAALNKLLLTLFEGLFYELVQERRPENYRGFPKGV